MNTGKTRYTFQFQARPELVNQIVLDWLRANGFELKNVKGENCHFLKDAWNGDKGFQYFINGNTIDIYAWLFGIGGKHIMLEKGGVSGNYYRDLLSGLFDAINRAGMNVQPQGGFQPQPNAPQQAYYQQPQNAAQFAQAFEAENLRKREKQCVIGFWLSILGLVLSLIGITFGVIIYMLNFYFASQGLKTRKRGMAIATIVLSVLSILITIVWLVLSAL